MELNRFKYLLADGRLSRRQINQILASVGVATVSVPLTGNWAHADTNHNATLRSIPYPRESGKKYANHCRFFRPRCRPGCRSVVQNRIPDHQTDRKVFRRIRCRNFGGISTVSYRPSILGRTLRALKRCSRCQGRGIYRTE